MITITDGTARMNYWFADTGSGSLVTNATGQGLGVFVVSPADLEADSAAGGGQLGFSIDGNLPLTLASG